MDKIVLITGAGARRGMSEAVARAAIRTPHGGAVAPACPPFFDFGGR